MRTLTAIALTVLVAVAGCGQAHHAYPASVRDNFLSSCQANGGSPSRCSCYLDKLQARVDLARFKRIDAAVRAGGPVPVEVTDAAADCD